MLAKLCVDKINTVLNRFDIAIAREHCVISVENFIRILRHKNMTPRTVIDIGVAFGTDWLYKGFPKAKFHLVDPSRESLPHMRAWTEKLNADTYNFALGESEGDMELAVRETIEHATLLRDLTSPDLVERYKVPVRRYDQVFANIERPALCKIDVEGAEIMVLRGMGEEIRSLDAIVLETSMNSLYQGGAEFKDVVSFMAEKDFSFFDIGGICRRPFDGALHQIDAIFVPDDSPLRVKRWD
jgi:FkbM family methyltransferase